MSELQTAWTRLNEKLNDLDQHPSALTKDVVLAELRYFYDQVSALSVPAAPVVKAVAAPAVPVAEPVAASPTPVVPEPEPVVEVTPVPTPVVAAAQPKVEEVVAPAPEPVMQAPVTPPAPEKPKAEAKPALEKTAEPEPDPDRNILAGKLNRSPLSDLRTGIPLNEKFGIIRNLFNGNASDYGDAVLKLNNAASAKEMNHYLSLLAQRFEWDLEGDSYRVFAAYVERRTLTFVPLNAEADQ